MKLKMALAAVALIAGSAWAGVVQTDLPVFNGFTPNGSFFGPDIDGDGTNEIIVIGQNLSQFSAYYSFAIYSISQKTYLYQMNGYLPGAGTTSTGDRTGPTFSKADFDFAPDGKSFCFGGDYFTIDGTTAASSNP